MATIEFWFEFASTYSYPAAHAVEAAAKARGVEVKWRSFLLGPIFAAQGWNDSPFNIYPAKGRHMVRDMQRCAEERGLAFAMPTVFPANSLLACRLALAGEAEGWTAAFSKAVYAAEFAEGRDIGEDALLASILRGLEIDADAVIVHARSQTIKDRLFARTAEAQARGIFGAPSFLTAAGELFWGDDRLEQALAWAKH